jgi:hypothetical protein
MAKRINSASTRKKPLGEKKMQPILEPRDRWDGLERLLSDYSLAELLEAARTNPSESVTTELQLRRLKRRQTVMAMDEVNEDQRDVSPLIYLG